MTYPIFAKLANVKLVRILQKGSVFVNVGVSEWLHDWVKEWLSGWLGEWVSGWVGERVIAMMECYVIICVIHIPIPKYIQASQLSQNNHDVFRYTQPMI